MNLFNDPSSENSEKAHFCQRIFFLNPKKITSSKNQIEIQTQDKTKNKT